MARGGEQPVAGRRPRGHRGAALALGPGADALAADPPPCRATGVLSGAGALTCTYGWIAPLGRSLTGGIPLAELWPSVVSVAGAGLSRIVVLDLVFGAAAGLLAWALAAADARVRDQAKTSDLVAAAG